MVWIFTIGCGVLQGCPFSGSLFVIAIDPLLHLFENIYTALGWDIFMHVQMTLGPLWPHVGH